MENIIHNLNPFPGIRSYEAGEDYLFFGREKQIQELVEKLNESHFIAVVGASGSGKSSLVRAGLVPSLFNGKMESYPGNWQLTLFRPGDDPYRNLSEALFRSTQMISNSIKSEETALREELTNMFNLLSFSDAVYMQRMGGYDPITVAAYNERLRLGENGLIDLIKEQNADIPRPRLVIIDQFEEIFRFKQVENPEYTKEILDQFVTLFLNAARQKEIPIFIVLTMRSDFLDQCTDFPGLPEMINNGNYLVPRMTSQEMRKAITGPIKVCEGEITEQLVQRLLLDVSNDPDQLPVLQHALMRTWDYWKINHSENQSVDIVHYEAVGTVKEALSLHAEEVYLALPNPQHKFYAEKMFKALTEMGDDKKPIRRPTRLKEITSLANGQLEDIITVIDMFREVGRAFLMPPNKIPLSEQTMIDISHESLMRIWTRLKQWVEEEAQSAQLYVRLSRSAELYQQGKAGLWVNPELELGLRWFQDYHPNEEWARRYDPAFERAIDFLEYSKKEYELQIARKEEQQRRQLQWARRFAIILGVASIISLLFLIISVNLRYKAESSEKIALEKEKIASTESRKAAEQRKEAILQKKISEQQQQIAEQQRIITEEQRQYALTQRQEALVQKQRAEVSQKQAISARDEAENQRKDAVSQRQIADKERVKAEQSEQKAQRLRFLAVARTIAIQSLKVMQTTNQWDIAALMVLQAYQFNLNNAGPPYQPDIYLALTAVEPNRPVYYGHTDAIRSLAIHSNGNWFFTGSDDGSIRQWSLSNPGQKDRILKKASNSSDGIRSLDIDMKGEWLAAGSASGTIYIWNLQAPNEVPIQLNGHQSVINKILFTRKGSILSAGNDGLVLLWNNPTKQSTKQILLQQSQRIYSLTELRDENAFLAGSADGNLFKLISDTRQATVFWQDTQKKPIMAIDISSDNRYLAVSDNRGAIYLFDRQSSNTKAIPLMGHLSTVNALRFSSNKDILLSASNDQSLRIWNYKNPEEPPIQIKEHDGWVYDTEFTPDQRYFLSVSADRTIRRWPAASAEIVPLIQQKVSRNLTNEEWNKYISKDVPYEKTLPQLP